MQARRGLTLLEILIALAIVLSISAIVVPLSLNELDRRTFEAAADAVEGHLLLARAEAQTAGRAIEVVYDPESRELIARWFGSPPPGTGTDPSTPAAAARPALGRPATLDDLFGAGADAGDDEREPIAMSWSQRQLPGRVEIDREPPPSDDDWMFLDDPSAGPGMSGTTMPTEQDMLSRLDSPFAPGAAPAMMRIAIYMPDGSALVTQPAWLFDDHDRASQLTIGAWTGLPQWRERRPRTTASLVEEDAARDAPATPPDTSAPRNGTAEPPANGDEQP